MKSILVFSDSHGRTDEMHKVIQSGEWDMIFHLGDCYDDILELKDCYEIPIYGVTGNVDFNDAQGLVTLDVEGHKIGLCHGHQFRVKSSKELIKNFAINEGYDIMLFGHTHEVHIENDGIYLLNPGSIRFPRSSSHRSYAIITLSEKTISSKLIYL